MLVMKELTDKFKLSVRSTGEVFEALNALYYRCRTTGEVQFRGKITREALVNAIILFVDSLSPEMKIQALKIGVDRLSEILDDAPASQAQAQLPGPAVAWNQGVDLTASIERAGRAPKAKPKPKKSDDEPGGRDRPGHHGTRRKAGS